MPKVLPVSDAEPSYEELYAERNAGTSSCWSEELREEQLQRWRRAAAAAAAQRRRQRGRPKRRTNNPIAKALGYRVREVMQSGEEASG